MPRTLPFSEVRAHLTAILDELEQLQEHVVITRNGRPTAVVMALNEYDALIETVVILQDPDLMSALAESERDVAAGRVRPWGEVKRELGFV